MKKTLLVIISILILFSLLYISFVNRNVDNLTNLPTYQINSWTYSFEIENDNIILSKNESSKQKVSYINTLDKVLYIWELNINWDTINIEKGQYLINIVDINWNYKIKWNWFEIENSWTSNIYIDNTGTRTLIFSQNSSIKLKFLDNTNTETLNSIYLFPHMWIRFNPSQNINIKSADILKLSQWYSISYFSEALIKNNELNNSFIKNIIWEENSNLEEIENIFNFIYIESNNRNKNLDFLNSYKLWTLLGERFIEWYSNLFLNDVKKVVYYKNTILKALWSINKEDNINDEDITYIYDLMNKVKSINNTDYNEMKKIIYFFIDNALNSYDYPIDKKINFSKLFNKIENKDYIFENNELIKLIKSYSIFDYNNSIETNIRYDELYKNLNSIDYNLVSTNYSENEKSYLILFLNKIIISWFDLRVNIDYLVKIFDNYSSISLPYYSKLEQARARTWISEYYTILDKLLNRIRIYFFQANRNNEWLLVLNNESIGNNEINNIQKNINSLVNFYTQNKTSLQEKEKQKYEENYELIITKSEEYFSALKDYNFYELNKREQDKYLFTDEITQYSLSTENAITYLSQFNYLDLSQSNIELRWYNYCEANWDDIDINDPSEAYCYKISNIILSFGNKRLDFNLIPKDYNKISNIKVNLDPNINRWTYRLDNQEDELESIKGNLWTNTQAEIYTFPNFFYYTFWLEEKIENIWENNSWENNNIEETSQETPTIRAFKSRLITKWGELYSENWFYNIEYNNIEVKEVNQEYDIKIKNWKINYNYQGHSIIGLLNTQYIQSNSPIFKNPELYFTEAWEYLLLWNKITFIWDYETKNFEQKIKIFFDYYDNLNSIINIVNSKIGNSNINISFDAINNNSFIISSEWIEIKFTNDSIESLVIENNEVLDGTININDLINYL